MKNILVAAFAALGLTAGVAAADDFDNTQMFTTVEAGAFEFTLEGDSVHGFTGMEVEAEVLTYGLGANVDASVELTFAYVEGVDAVALGIENTITYDEGALDVYATPRLVYVASTDDFGNGDFFTAPTLGASYDFNKTVTGFGEVSYAWNVSEDFDRQGGMFEVGADFALTETVTLTPSVVRTFDTADDETQARIGVTFSF